MLREGVECPPLSPDETRIASKQRADAGAGPIEWQVAVLDLRTGAIRSLPDTRGVDDQVEWIDDERLAYRMPRAASGSPVPNV